MGKVIELYGLLGHIILMLNSIRRETKAHGNVIKSNLAKEKTGKIVQIEKGISWRMKLLKILSIIF